MKTLIFFFLSFSLVGCQQDDFFEKEAIAITEVPKSGNIQHPEVPLPPPPIKDLICDPFNHAGEHLPDKHGIYAKLYDASNYPNVTHLEHVIREEHKMPSDLYFSQINVTPRDFTQGFTGPNGKPLQNAAGTKLDEWFGLKFMGRFKLAANEAAGYYELLTHADDGVIIRAKVNGQQKEVLSDDGWHPPRIGCAKELIYLDRNTDVEFEIDYFQGPRTAISLVLYWRRVGNKNISSSPHCGAEPIYAETIQELVDEGFTKLKPHNFLLPKEISRNPCSSK